MELSQIDKNKILIGIGLIIVSFIFLIINKSMFKETYKDPYKTVGVAAGEYYKTIYDTKDNKVEFARNFEDSGIEFNINEILVVLEYDATKDFLKENKCDYEKGKVTVFPKSPYGKENFEYKVEMECK